MNKVIATSHFRCTFLKLWGEKSWGEKFLAIVEIDTGLITIDYYTGRPFKIVILISVVVVTDVTPFSLEATRND